MERSRQPCTYRWALLSSEVANEPDVGLVPTYLYTSPCLVRNCIPPGTCRWTLVHAPCTSWKPVSPRSCGYSRHPHRLAEVGIARCDGRRATLSERAASKANEASCPRGWHKDCRRPRARARHRDALGHNDVSRPWRSLLPVIAYGNCDDGARCSCRSFFNSANGLGGISRRVARAASVVRGGRWQPRRRPKRYEHGNRHMPWRLLPTCGCVRFELSIGASFFQLQRVHVAWMMNCWQASSLARASRPGRDGVMPFSGVAPAPLGALTPTELTNVRLTALPSRHHSFATSPSAVAVPIDILARLQTDHRRSHAWDMWRAGTFVPP